MVLGKIASDIYNEAKKVAPLRHVGIRKSKLLSAPAQAPAKSQPQIEEAEQATEEAAEQT
jgi:small subunit ribosomal protein S3Ae